MCNGTRCPVAPSSGRLLSVGHCDVAMRNMRVRDSAAHRTATVAGLARARAAGKQLGRPRLAVKIGEAIRRALAEPGRPGLRVIGKRFGVSPSTVRRILRGSSR